MSFSGLNISPSGNCLPADCASHSGDLAAVSLAENFGNRLGHGRLLRHVEDAHDDVPMQNAHTGAHVQRSRQGLRSHRQRRAARSVCSARPTRSSGRAAVTASISRMGWLVDSAATQCARHARINQRG